MQKTDLKKLAAEINPKSFLDYRKYLAALYAHIKGKVEDYTYFQFASDLGFSATNVMHHIIKGRRPLTHKAALTICKALHLTGNDRKYFEILVDFKNARTPVEQDELFKKLCEIKQEELPGPVEKDSLSYFYEWYHPIIGEMARLDEFRSDPEWIARNLVAPLRPLQVQKSLELLEGLGIIRYDETQGRHVRTDKNISTGHETAEISIASYHQEMINIGRQSISKVKQEKRDISAVTICVSEEAVTKLKALAHEFQMILLAEEEKCQNKDQVYQVNIQLFPLTKIKKRS